MISFSKLTNVYKGNCVINIKIQCKHFTQLSIHSLFGL